MRRYRRASVENVEQLNAAIFQRKTVISANIPQKSAGKIFWYWCRKDVPHRKTRFPPKKQKTLQSFLLQNGGYRTPESSPGKICEKRKKWKKSSFIHKIDNRFRHLQLYLWEWRLFDNYFDFFLLLTNTFCLSRCIESLQYYSISESACLNFQLMSFLPSRLSLSAFGVLWRPPSPRGSCQVSY